MNNVVKTTVNLPADLMMQAKIYSATNNVTLSELIKEAVKGVVFGGIKIKPKVMPKLGRFHLGNIKAPSRKELYDNYFKRKFPSGL